jgi:hypothetical protein
MSDEDGDCVKIQSGAAGSLKLSSQMEQHQNVAKKITVMQVLSMCSDTTPRKIKEMEPIGSTEERRLRAAELIRQSREIKQSGMIKN